MSYIEQNQSQLRTYIVKVWMCAHLSVQISSFYAVFGVGATVGNPGFDPESKAAETDSLRLFSDQVSEAVQSAEDRLNTIPKPPFEVRVLQNITEKPEDAEALKSRFHLLFSVF